MKYFAFIPARGGSKGVIGKNLRPLQGKPLIAWSIEHALESTMVDRVIVSTDDEQIAEVSRQFGAEVPFMRPQEIADDYATTESAMLHAVQWLKENEQYRADAMILLQCTSPIRSKGIIDRAIRQYENEQADSLLGVVPFWHFLWKPYPKPSALYDYQNRPRRQDIKKEDICMKESGSIYISSIKGLCETQNRLHGNISMLEMTENEGYEIDTLVDFQVIEALLENQEGT